MWMAAGSSPSGFLAHLVDLHGRECWSCGARWQPGPRPPAWHHECGPPEPVPVALEVDHVRPLWSLADEERGQPRWWLPYNLQVLCAECHKAKTAAEAAERARIKKLAIWDAQGMPQAIQESLT